MSTVFLHPFFFAYRRYSVRIIEPDTTVNFLVDLEYMLTFLITAPVSGLSGVVARVLL